MTLRLAKAEDFDAMYDIYMDETVNPFMLHDPMSKEDFRAVFNGIMARNYSWVYEDSGHVVGMCSATIGGGRTSHVAMLLSLGIKKDIQNKGLGGKIVREAMAILQQQGVLRFEVGVESDNVRGIAFYKKLGFAIEGTFKNYVKRGPKHYIDALLMAHNLPV